jgi:hypothetical protein
VRRSLKWQRNRNRIECRVPETSGKAPVINSKAL